MNVTLRWCALFRIGNGHVTRFVAPIHERLCTIYIGQPVHDNLILIKISRDEYQRHFLDWLMKKTVLDFDV